MLRALVGARYYVTFINDHSKKVWAYDLKSKGQALEKLKQFNTSVEREPGKKLKHVRSNNGGEYRGPFEEYSKIDGIKFKKTEQKWPQRNRVTERMNRTINERIHCMLSHAKLPKSFWGRGNETSGRCD